MSLERCPECGHPTRVYADAGNREHEPGCSLAAPPARPRPKCQSCDRPSSTVYGGLRSCCVQCPRWGQHTIWCNRRNPAAALLGGDQ